ncbi:MAG: divergent PAP2 family protein [Agathobacter sp.]|nr:divergent PAP2 family protein [Agathobacter sp.]
MEWLFDLLGNGLLVTAVSSWAIAQVLKIFIHWWIYKKFDIMRLFGDGGMPSGHSATVSSMAVLSALAYGTGSFQFAVTAMLAIIVCHDAMGVRREAGKQAVVLNELIKSLDIIFTDEVAEVKLKEFVGHTPYQVAAGVIIGALNAAIMHFFFFI